MAARAGARGCPPSDGSVLQRRVLAVPGAHAAGATRGQRGRTGSSPRGWFPSPLVLTDTEEVALVLLPALFHLQAFLCCPELSQLKYFWLAGVFK